MEKYMLFPSVEFSVQFDIVFVYLTTLKYSRATNLDLKNYQHKNYGCVIKCK